MSVPQADSYPGGQPPRPGSPGRPGEPPEPGWPAPHRPPAAPPANLPPAPSRGWPGQGDWPGRIYQRLLEQRIVLASGHLDGEAATVLCAQLLTLDAEGDGPVRLELQGLDAELPAALTVMGVPDVLRVPETGYVDAQLGGAALGVLADGTGRESDEIRGDARRGLFLPVDAAVSYGLIEAQATAEARRPAGPRR